MYYYKTPSDLSPVGSIFLPHFTQIERDMSRPLQYCWRLSSSLNLTAAGSPVQEDPTELDTEDTTTATQSRVYFAYADSEKDMQEWIDAVKPLLSLGDHEQPPALPEELPPTPPLMDDSVRRRLLNEECDASDSDSDSEREEISVEQRMKELDRLMARPMNSLSGVEMQRTYRLMKAIHSQLKQAAGRK